MEGLKNRILVVDDEPEIVSTLSDFLSLKGYDVTRAFSGEEAIDILTKKAIDLLLLDLKLPGMQGQEVARIVKERYPLTKIVIVTGYANEHLAIFKDTQLEGVFIKPVKLQELQNKLLGLLGKKQISQADTAFNEEVRLVVMLIKMQMLLVIRNMAGQNYQYN